MNAKPQNGYELESIAGLGAKDGIMMRGEFDFAVNQAELVFLLSVAGPRGNGRVQLRGTSHVTHCHLLALPIYMTSHAHK